MKMMINARAMGMMMTRGMWDFMHKGLRRYFVSEVIYIFGLEQVSSDNSSRTTPAKNGVGGGKKPKKFDTPTSHTKHRL